MSAGWCGRCSCTKLCASARRSSEAERLVRCETNHDESGCWPLPSTATLQRVVSCRQRTVRRQLVPVSWLSPVDSVPNSAVTGVLARTRSGSDNLNGFASGVLRTAGQIIKAIFCRGGDDVEKSRRKSSERRWMRDLAGRARTSALHLPAVQEVNGLHRGQVAHQRRHIVLRTHARRARAEPEAVGRMIDQRPHLAQDSAIGDDARQPEDRPGRVVRVNGQLHICCGGHGHHALEQVGELF